MIHIEHKGVTRAELHALVRLNHCLIDDTLVIKCYFVYVNICEHVCKNVRELQQKNFLRYIMRDNS